MHVYAIICCRTSRDVIIVLSQHFNANVNLHDLQYLLPAYLYMYNVDACIVHCKSRLEESLGNYSSAWLQYCSDPHDRCGEGGLGWTISYDVIT